ncbi:hypothetical protein [Tunicatimonas pelagia]|uniref:hypothetical protein n=1 Tax=Tunicatimonas pelagia TaxID=931531 RepID=UPI002666675F|nr:hypothetical protein [Tunicatimonas pelagia]WKN46450.1 hypothetical protein P0M28_30845 [Tunicatimonas pelagia]
MISNTNQHSVYQPVSCLMVYQLVPQQEVWGYPYTEDTPQYYLEQHQLYERKGKFHLREGVPMRPETLSEIVTTLAQEQQTERTFAGRVPQRLIYFSHSPEVLVWQVPAKFRSLAFRMHGVGEGHYPCPHLVFRVVNNEQLQVFATKSKQVTERTPLFQAPFPNISSNGQVCLGSARSWIEEPATYEAFMQQWERIFFDSLFNTDSYHNRAKIPLADLWKPLRGNDGVFPKKHLLPTTYRVNQLRP